jgi:hypothetical protein
VVHGLLLLRVVRALEVEEVLLRGELHGGGGLLLRGPEEG